MGSGSLFFAADTFFPVVGTVEFLGSKRVGMVFQLSVAAGSAKPVCKTGVGILRPLSRHIMGFGFFHNKAAGTNLAMTLSGFHVPVGQYIMGGITHLIAAGTNTLPVVGIVAVGCAAGTNDLLFMYTPGIVANMMNMMSSGISSFFLYFSNICILLMVAGHLKVI
jgi:hypothetical protein